MKALGSYLIAFYAVAFVVILKPLPPGDSTDSHSAGSPRQAEFVRYLAQKSAQKSAQPAGDASRDDEAERRAEQEEYYELLKLFADTLDQVDRNYVQNVSRRELMEAAIEGMIRKLDQYSNYIPPEKLDNFKTDVESEFGGIGIRITTESGRLQVISPLHGSPAYREGVRAGDLILEIDGKPTEGLSIDEVVSRLKGPLGTSVRLRILHSDSAEPLDVTVRRDTVRIATVVGLKRDADGRWNYWLDESQGLAYVRITSFGRHTVSELRELFPELEKQGLRGLVLDLRFNPGGLLSAAIETSDLFLPQGRIVSTKGRNIPQRIWDAHQEGTLKPFPLAVLVNGFSASASEIVAAALQDHRRAVVVGERTWGKGSVQNIIELEGGRSALKLTTGSYQRPNGKNIHRFPDDDEDAEWGVRPSEGYAIEFTRRELILLDAVQRRRDLGGTPSTAAEFEDRQLEKAAEYVRGQLSSQSSPAGEPDSPEKTGDAKSGDAKNDKASDAKASDADAGQGGLRD